MLKRELRIDHRYLILPVRRRTAAEARGQWGGNMRLCRDGQVLRHFDIDLADGSGDYQVFSDLQPFLGQRLQVEFEGTGAASLDGLRLAAEPVPPESLYRERLRPQFHFSSRRGWNNDPNGLFCFGGEYHLLYQHNPYSVEWGNLHWGHAVSRDLVHWTERPVALYPDELGAMSTGCAVVDSDNTSGLGSAGAPAIVAVYTAGHASWTPGFVQCLAISTDGGTTWSKYDGNPVIEHIVHRNRDPKVIWHPQTERWVMVLYMDRFDYAIFTSPNLLQWERVSDLELPRCTECPELFPLALDGEQKWVFWGANTTYLVGSFDGRTFRPEQGPRKLQPDGNGYAAQTWSDVPAEDGRRIQMAWLRQQMPGMPFGQCMTVAHSLRLQRRGGQVLLTADPVRELESLRVERWQVADTEIAPARPLEAEVSGELLDVEVELELGSADCVGVVVRGVPVFYDRRLGALCCGGYTVPMPAPDGPFTWRILADRASLELYADGGAVNIAAGVILPEWERSVRLVAAGGSAVAKRVTVARLRSAWPLAEV
ncbi:MAG: glycoside hydrolase family 32 protein [Spirochaetaceae bacterium]|nr:glycoside hydrolase family 32 protein [Spirochaetaceae bacterium]